MPNIPLDLPHKGPLQNGPSQHPKNSDTARLSSATNKAKIDAQRLPSMDDTEHSDQKGHDIPQNVDDCQNITAMSRLLDKTNSQMEALETKTQRNMMAQLRSAFAMILADQKNPEVVLRAPAPKEAENLCGILPRAFDRSIFLHFLPNFFLYEMIWSSSRRLALSAINF